MIDSYHVRQRIIIAAVYATGGICSYGGASFGICTGGVSHKAGADRGRRGGAMVMDGDG